MTRSIFRITLGLLTVGAMACVQEAVPVDNGSPDAGVVERNCATPEDHGNLGALGGAATVEPQETAGNVIRLNADIDPVSPRDVLSIQLWDGVGPFAGGAVAPGVYTLGGAEGHFSTCGACVTIVADIVPMVGPTEIYIAQSGTLTIDSVSPTVSGSLADVVLQTFDLNTGAPIPGGCTTSIAQAAVSAAVP